MLLTAPELLRGVPEVDIMKSKRTSEGHIFHCEGGREIEMVRRLLEDGSDETGLRVKLQERLAAGEGVFCVFDSEAGGFVSLMEHLETRLGVGEDPMGAMLCEIARELRDRCSLAG